MESSHSEHRYHQVVHSTWATASSWRDRRW